MSIWATLLYMDGEDGELPRPIVYQYNDFPMDTQRRSGAVAVSAIPGYVRDDQADLDKFKPYLRLSMSTRTDERTGVGLDSMDVTLDREQVRALADTLAGWLENSEDGDE